MTDPGLVRRAEQALLGALITRQDEPDTVAAIAASGGLRPRDFTDPRHQAICAALTGNGFPRHGGLAGLAQRLRDLLARLPGTPSARQARELAAYTATLPGCCPDPANLASYAAMITAAARDRAARAAARENPRLASAAGWLDTTAATARSRSRRHRSAPGSPVTDTAAAAHSPAPAAATAKTAGPGPAAAGPGPLPADIARMARLLRTAMRPPAGKREDPAAPGVGGADRVPLGPDSLQDQVLADLMRRPGQAGQITAWLPAAVFTPGPRRDLYGLICSRLADSDPVDPLIIAWEASRQPAAASGGQSSAPAHGESVPAAALRIGQLDPTLGTAEVLGRALYAGHLCTQALGPGWERSHKSGRPAAPQPVAPAPQRTATPFPAGPAPAGHAAGYPGPAVTAGAAAPAPGPAGPPPPRTPPVTTPAGPAQRM